MNITQISAAYSYDVHRQVWPLLTLAEETESIGLACRKRGQIPPLEHASKFKHTAALICIQERQDTGMNYQGNKHIRRSDSSGHRGPFHSSLAFQSLVYLIPASYTAPIFLSRLAAQHGAKDNLLSLSSRLDAAR